MPLALNRFSSSLHYHIFKKCFSVSYKIEGKETIYASKEKKEKKIGHFYENKKTFLVEVNDETIGKKLLDVIKAIEKKSISEIWTENAVFELTKYSLNRTQAVNWFEFDCWYDIDWSKLSRNQQLLEIAVFLEGMQGIGFTLSDIKFEENESIGISKFLACFTEVQLEGQMEESKGRMLEYIHFVLTEGTSENRKLKEFYEDAMQKQPFLIGLLPYSLSICEICYEYFKTGRVYQSISQALAVNDENEVKDAYLVFDKDLESKVRVIEKTNEYIFYEGNWKIYHSNPSEFSDFVLYGYYQHSIITRNDVFRVLSIKNTLETIDVLIYDLSGNIIGYRVKTKLNRNKYQSILEVPFKSQYEIVNWISQFYRVLESIHPKTICSSAASSYFDMEKAIVWKIDSFVQKNDSQKPLKVLPEIKDFLKFVSIKDMLQFGCQDFEFIKQQITRIFFKLLVKYMNQKYGEFNDSKEFLKKDEIKAVSPALSKELVSFVFGKKNKFSVKKATKETFDFLENRGVSIDSQICYDSRYCYDPTKISFVLEADVKDKYQMEATSQSTRRLPDGRLLVIFDKPMAIDKFAKGADEKEKAIKTQYANVEDDHVKLLRISEIILQSKNLNGKNMIGYVTEPIKGEKLDWSLLLKMNNKDVIKVCAYLFSKIHISLSNLDYLSENCFIWMDEGLHFLIDYLNMHFHIDLAYASRRYIKSIFTQLILRGYSKYAFDGLKFISGKHDELIKMELLEYAEKLDTFCEEHKQYYCSEDALCPICRQTKLMLPENFEETHSVLFEDDVARHYSLDSEYNLKIYKANCEDLDRIRVNVGNLVENAVTSQNNMFQDCFKPIKKILNNKGTILGYVYKATDFENKNQNEVCMDLSRMSSLPKLKGLIRLLMQVEQIMEEGYGFFKNPFGSVYINPAHKKQVQILNIDFMQQGQNKEDTIQWVCQYVFQALQSDKTLEMLECDSLFPEEEEKWKDRTVFKALLESLTNLSGELTKYCSVHKIFYLKHHVFCPICMKPDLQEENVEFSKKESYLKLKSFDEGGESIIYATGNSVVKIFREGKVNLDSKGLVILRVLQKKHLLQSINEEKNKYHYVIPEKLLVDKESNHFFGYRMEKVNNSFPVSILRDKDQVKKLGFSIKDILEVLITIGEGIERLHQDCNIYIGDLNGRNILFDKEKNVYFLDFDGMGIDEMTPEFCTDGYIDPLSKKNQNITKKDDWYSFAIQAFYYLTYTHPFNGIYYAEINGRRVALEIPDKMERRISLLGNHGMKPPAIANPWDWMKKDLQNAFLNIFENENRESIVPYLKQQYQSLFSTDVNYENQEKQENYDNYTNQEVQKIHRINPKFIAKEVNVFDEEILRIFSPYAAIGKDSQGEIVLLLRLKERNYVVPFENVFEEICCSYDEIKHILFSEEEESLVFIFHQDEDDEFDMNISVLDLKEEEILTTEEIEISCNHPLDSSYVQIVNHAIYKKEVYDGTAVIEKKEILMDGNVEEDLFEIGGRHVCDFLVDEHKRRRFLLILKGQGMTDEVYCNNEMVHRFFYPSLSFRDIAKYCIRYDKITKLWVVINNYGKGIVLLRDGSKEEICVSDSLSDKTLSNIKFKNENLYIPLQDYLMIVNVKTKLIKKMECCKIMTPDSYIYDINSYGFSVLTDHVFYEVRKG